MEGQERAGIPPGGASAQTPGGALRERIQQDDAIDMEEMERNLFESLSPEDRDWIQDERRKRMVERIYSEDEDEEWRPALFARKRRGRRRGRRERPARADLGIEDFDKEIPEPEGRGEAGADTQDGSCSEIPEGWAWDAGGTPESGTGEAPGAPPGGGADAREPEDPDTGGAAPAGRAGTKEEEKMERNGRTPGQAQESAAWTKEDLGILEAHIEKEGAGYCAARLGRSMADCYEAHRRVTEAKPGGAGAAKRDASGAKARDGAGAAADASGAAGDASARAEPGIPQASSVTATQRGDRPDADTGAADRGDEEATGVMACGSMAPVARNAAPASGGARLPVQAAQEDEFYDDEDEEEIEDIGVYIALAVNEGNCIRKLTEYGDRLVQKQSALVRKYNEMIHYKDKVTELQNVISEMSAEYNGMLSQYKELTRKIKTLG